MNKYFGPVDPFVLLPASALGSMAIVLLLNGVVLWGLATGILTGLLVVFDSWANRRDPIPQRRPTPHRYTRY